MRKIFTILSIVFISLVTFEKKIYSSNNDGNLVKIIVLYTNDEHGWMEPTNNFDGAPGLLEMWKTFEGYDGSENYLIISGGDMWTGPAISTWFQGESMVEIMNALDYDVAAVGNHDFDFKIEGLNTRLEQMKFPFVCANIKNKSTGEIPDFVKPYIILDIEGVKIGIIGLASLSTPVTTAPANVEDFEFTPYSDAVITYSEKAKQEGAEVLIVAGHICEDEMEKLAPIAKENGISIIGGGHCHELLARESSGVILIEARSGMRAYVKVEFEFDKSKNQAMNFYYETVINNKHKIDSGIQEIVNYWANKAEEELSDVIGFADETIRRSSTEMANMVCDSWFYTFPNADVSITNSGGLRQDIFQGEISLETIVGLLPFDNTIYELEFTGTELMEVADDFLLGGMTTTNGYKLLDGTPVFADSIYIVLTTDYLYSISDNNFSRYDSDPMNTYVHFRQPLIDWIKSLNTSTTNPINNYLDTKSRH